MPLDPDLRNALQSLRDTLDDASSNSYKNAQGDMRRLLKVADGDPIRSLLAPVISAFDATAWWNRCVASRGSMAGSGALDWPEDLEARIACRLQVCRVAAQSEGAVLDVIVQFFGVSGNLNLRYHEFIRVVARPLERDIDRVARGHRPNPALAAGLARGVPVSGDDVTDALLREAIGKFQDPTPLERKYALDRLWDAFGRLKTIDVPGNKPKSIGALLDRITDDPVFRNILEQEAKALTDTGNALQIRHYETDTSPIRQASHIDYLFHRLFAFVWLALSHRTPERPMTGG